MPSKAIRDPLYNYVNIDLPADQWLLDVLNCREMQRLRRIHQLGVSNFTYPGADHSRLVHSIGVLHLMQQAVRHFGQTYSRAELTAAKPFLLAAALVHDVGHGPFSHLFEPCLGIDHEEWSLRIILDPSTELNRRLRDFDSAFPKGVADLIDTNNQERPQWQKYLVSSQLDMDRLDYLRRDSLFTGAGYGHYDWHRLINTMEIVGSKPAEWEIVWGDKARLAIEEYIFSRYYMYQNVYLHKTTRCFEQLLQAMWKRAKFLRDDGDDISLVPAIRDFWQAEDPTPQQYLAIEEFTVLSQIQAWSDHRDRALSDLARRFLCRDRFKMIEAPETYLQLEPDLSDWEDALRGLVESQRQFAPSWMYCLRDELKPKYNQPYFPEKESDEQSVKNAIRIKANDGNPVEISTLLPRLKPLTDKPIVRFRYYVPAEIERDALKLRSDWKVAPVSS